MTQTEYINQALRDHQIDDARTWVHSPRVRRLHDSFHIFPTTLFKAQPPPVLSIIGIKTTPSTQPNTQEQPYEREDRNAARAPDADGDGC